MNAVQNISVGTVVIYRQRYNSSPVTGNVSKVTKTQFRATLGDGTEVGPFHIKTNFDYSTESLVHDSVSTHSKDSCAVFSEVLWEKMINNYLVSQKQKEEKEQEQLKRAKERAERIARETAEALEAIGGPLGIVRNTLTYYTAPDGTRVRLINVPVKNNNRKGSWELVLLTLRNSQGYSYQTGEYEPKIELAYTYANGNSHSFASISSENFDSEEAAVNEAIRSVYHAW